MANVVEPGLSGLTSCVPTAGQLDALNATMCKFLRVLERGKACTWKEVSEEIGELMQEEPSTLQTGLPGMKAVSHQAVAMSNLELLKRWKLLPIPLELAVRRVNWLQSIIRYPAANEQVVAAVFGRMEVRGDGWKRVISALDSDGHLCDE